MECFRIDESGYTGFDLLNRDQPFQGAAAVAIDDKDAALLIERHFPNLQATELKFSALVRRPGNHAALLALQRDLLSAHKCVTYVCEKRFLLILMFLDYATEPYWYRRGVDFYADGRNFALASLVSMAGPHILGEEALEQLLAAFQHAVKVKTPEALQALVEAARCTNWQELPEALRPLVMADPDCLKAIATRGVTTDAAFLILQGLITRMEIMADGPYRVEHDQSKNLLVYHDLLEQIARHEADAEFLYSQVSRLAFPLKLSEVTQVDSKASSAVQLADVLVGAAIQATNTMSGHRAGGLDPEALLSLYSDDQFIHLVPSIDFDEEKRFRRGTQSAESIDYFASNFRFRG
jgi:hypothetical protein